MTDTEYWADQALNLAVALRKTNLFLENCDSAWKEILSATGPGPDDPEGVEDARLTGWAMRYAIEELLNLNVEVLNKCDKQITFQ